MKKATLILVVSFTILMLAVPAYAGSCERCGFYFLCLFDECQIIEECRDPLNGRLGAENCWISGFGFCHVSQETCLEV